jgi:hypothetical protein
VIYVYAEKIVRRTSIMWEQGTINGYDYWVKHYDNGSEYGIDGGQISKLTIRRRGEARDLCSYNRGWDIEPQDAEVKAVYEQLLKQYN